MKGGVRPECLSSTRSGMAMGKFLSSFPPFFQSLPSVHASTASEAYSKAYSETRCSSSQKSGNETFAQSASSMVVVPCATRPAMPMAMAMR